LAGSIPESERVILENAYPDHRSLGKAYFTLKWVDEYVQLFCPNTFHSLRAIATTVLHAAEADHALAREIVGHDSEMSHQLHIRPSDDQCKEAMEKLSEMIVPSACSEDPIEMEKRDLVALCPKCIRALMKIS
jgi:hypothetical protein